MLREMLNRDFGIDLPISGGPKSSLDSPIAIECDTTSDARFVQMRVMQLVLGFGGIYWRILQSFPLQGREGIVERVVYETKKIEGDEKITEVKEMFFSFPKLNFDNLPANCFINLGPHYPINIPFKICWLNYISIVENESEHPGLGLTIDYNSPMIKATIYIYNKLYPRLDIEEDLDVLEREFSHAVSDIVRAYPSAVVSNETRHEGWYYSSFEIEQWHTSVMISIIGNHFIKVRMTISDPSEELYFTCAMETLANISRNAVFWVVAKPGSQDT